MKKLILPLVMLLPATAIWSFDAYFYKEDANRAIHVAKNVTCLEFKPSTTVVTRSDFTTSELDNSTFHHLLFRDKSTSGMTASVTSASKIKISVNGTILHVTADAPITSLQIISASGVQVASLPASASNLTHDISDLVPGIYIVLAQSDNQVSVSKIIKK